MHYRNMNTWTIALSIKECWKTLKEWISVTIVERAKCKHWNWDWILKIKIKQNSEVFSLQYQCSAYMLLCPRLYLRMPECIHSSLLSSLHLPTSLWPPQQLLNVNSSVCSRKSQAGQGSSAKDAKWEPVRESERKRERQSGAVSEWERIVLTCNHVDRLF